MNVIEEANIKESKNNVDDVKMTDMTAANDNSKPAISQSTTMTNVETVTKKPKVMAPSSREKKKPSRDSSSWGTSAPVSVLPKIPLTSDSTPQAPKTDPSKEHTKSNGKQAVKSNKRKKGNSNHIRPTPKLMRYIIQAIMQFEMIEEGDRLLLGLSGGKDSLSLLHCRKLYVDVSQK